MQRNVGDNERYVRLGIGAAAALAATRTTGWQRGVLSGIAGSMVYSGLSQYCPLNQAFGIDRYHSDAAYGDRNARIREQTAVNSALGLPPGDGADTPPVTREDSLLGRQEVAPF